MRKDWVDPTEGEIRSEPLRLDKEDRALLRDGYLVEIAGQYGYQYEV